MNNDHHGLIFFHVAKILFIVIIIIVDHTTIHL